MNLENNEHLWATLRGGVGVPDLRGQGSNKGGLIFENA